MRSLITSVLVVTAIVLGVFFVSPNPVRTASVHRTIDEESKDEELIWKVSGFGRGIWIMCSRDAGADPKGNTASPRFRRYAEILSETRCIFVETLRPDHFEDFIGRTSATEVAPIPRGAIIFTGKDSKDFCDLVQVRRKNETMAGVGVMMGLLDGLIGSGTATFPRSGRVVSLNCGERGVAVAMPSSRELLDLIRGISRKTMDDFMEESQHDWISWERGEVEALRQSVGIEGRFGNMMWFREKVFRPRVVELCSALKSVMTVSCDSIALLPDAVVIDKGGVIDVLREEGFEVVRADRKMISDLVRKQKVRSAYAELNHLFELANENRARLLRESQPSQLRLVVADLPEIVCILGNGDALPATRDVFDVEWERQFSGGALRLEGPVGWRQDLAEQAILADCDRVFTEWSYANLGVRHGLALDFLLLTQGGAGVGEDSHIFSRVMRSIEVVEGSRKFRTERGRTITIENEGVLRLADLLLSRIPQAIASDSGTPSSDFIPVLADVEKVLGPDRLLYLVRNLDGSFTLPLLRIIMEDHERDGAVEILAWTGRTGEYAGYRTAFIKEYGSRIAADLLRSLQRANSAGSAIRIAEKWNAAFAVIGADNISAFRKICGGIDGKIWRDLSAVGTEMVEDLASVEEIGKWLEDGGGIELRRWLISCFPIYSDSCRTAVISLLERAASDPDLAVRTMAQEKLRRVRRGHVPLGP